jgi:HEAT repeat protein
MSADQAPEADAVIARLLARSGDAQYARIRGEALDWLLTHAEVGYPRLLAIADTANPPSLAVLALARFGRVDGVLVLARLLRDADDPMVVLVAGALAEDPAPEAFAVLVEALSSPRDQVVASAADALAQRGDAAACGPLAAASEHPDPDVRARVEFAAARLGCPSRG